MTHQTCTWDIDPACLLVSFLLFIHVLNYLTVLKMLDLYTVWCQITREMNCYTVHVECRHYFSWMLHHYTSSHRRMIIFSCFFCFVFLGLCVISFWTWSQNLLLLNVFWLALKRLILKCTVTYSTLMRPLTPRLPLKYLVYPKRSFHVLFFFFFFWFSQVNLFIMDKLLLVHMVLWNVPTDVGSILLFKGGERKSDLHMYCNAKNVWISTPLLSIMRY